MSKNSRHLLREPLQKTKILNYCSTRLFQDCAWKKRFAFGEQPFPTPRWVLNEDFPPDSKRHGSQTGVTAANGHLLLNAEVAGRRSRNPITTDYSDYSDIRIQTSVKSVKSAVKNLGAAREQLERLQGTLSARLAWKKRFAARTALTRHGVLRKLRAMSQPDDFSAYVAELLDGRYDCVDRLVLNGYFPMGQTSGAC
jgi:hypothetical protein